MLATVGVESLDELVDRAVPEAIRDRTPLDLPTGLTEAEALARLRALADRNEVFTSLIGMGYSGTITPPVILRNVLENPAWYTAYTPYQPEISQGRLEALLNFQTMVSDLTGMDLANASLLDEATAAAEAMAMLRRLNPKAGDTFFVDAECHPQTIDVVAHPRRAARHRRGGRGARARTCAPRACSACCCSTRAPAGRSATTASWWRTSTRRARWSRWRPTCSRWCSSPRRGRGAPTSWSAPRSASACRSATAARTPRSSPPATTTSATCPAGSSACRSTPPGARRCGSRCRRGSSTSGARRPRATSAPRRCCSRSSPACTRCTTGPTACARSPSGCTDWRAGLAAALARRRCTSTFFDTVTVRVPGAADDVVARARAAGINLRRVDDDTVGIALDETTTPRGRGACARGRSASPRRPATAPAALPPALRRTSDILAHPVFRTYHSETQMLRYLRRSPTATSRSTAR